jgi:hypothetical protein
MDDAGSGSKAGRAWASPPGCARGRPGGGRSTPFEHRYLRTSALTWNGWGLTTLREVSCGCNASEANTRPGPPGLVCTPSTAAVRPLPGIRGPLQDSRPSVCGRIWLCHGCLTGLQYFLRREPARDRLRPPTSALPPTDPYGRVRSHDRSQVPERRRCVQVSPGRRGVGFGITAVPPGSPTTSCRCARQQHPDDRQGPYRSEGASDLRQCPPWRATAGCSRPRTFPTPWRTWPG